MAFARRMFGEESEEWARETGKVPGERATVQYSLKEMELRHSLVQLRPSHTSKFANILNAPLLSSLTIVPVHSSSPFRPSIEMPSREFEHQYSHSVHLALETISLLKLELPPRMINIVEVLTSLSVLPSHPAARL
ncbi:hypothetical protein ARMSODRAFT_1019267 [Armillaria solidipes]|uniref:Uncharacterized protein n=1 Tax=Armillaria solidipes TaxID=1076256 RepID=A0A2H3BVQ6_9AGAR|nr:hypothetical protein ARMSODRAFT_1019267 [Armillaria solidipes]